MKVQKLRDEGFVPELFQVSALAIYPFKAAAFRHKVSDSVRDRIQSLNITPFLILRYNRL